MLHTSPLSAGSSPRVRGTPCRGSSPPVRFRFIPACAGNACERTCERIPNAVHPRVCGERCANASRNCSCSGSSPRVRGTLGKRFAKVHSSRFIPACAGNAPLPCGGSCDWAVHPRVCGERALVDLGRHLGAGSSPRVRGTLAGVGRTCSSRRFIPACAGNAFV